VLEILQVEREVEVSGFSGKICHAGVATGLVAFVTLGAGWATAENPKRLSGSQIRAKFAGMQLTDEVHWRDVYERDGTLRSYAMGSKKIGKWFVHSDELCLDLPEPDGGCFEVTATGTNFVLTPKGLGSPLEGILQPPPDNK